MCEDAKGSVERKIARPDERTFALQIDDTLH
jgi:hypothetical protein